MSGYVEQGEVVRNEQIGSDVWIMDIHAPKQAAEAKVGQFCNVRVADSTAPLLRRPISYAGFDAQKGIITLLYRVVGKVTEIMTLEEELKIRWHYGYDEGKAAGFEKGVAQKQREIAKNLKQSGISVEVIVKNTGLTAEEVEKL